MGKTTEPNQKTYSCEEGALGFYVYNSKASFRNVVVESLK